jgi:quercetin dioxygenase-like cupin family protein
MLVSSMHSRPAMQGRSADALKDVLRAAGRTFPAPAKSPPSAVDTTALRHVLGELNAAHLFLPAPADAHIAPLSPGEARALCAPSRIRYLSIEDTQPNYSIGVFLIPRGARIPLHDHIGMTVVSKLLYGTMEVSSFTLRADPAAAQDDGAQRRRARRAPRAGRAPSRALMHAPTRHTPPAPALVLQAGSCCARRRSCSALRRTRRSSRPPSKTCTRFGRARTARCST